MVIGGILYDSRDGSYRTSKYLPYFIDSIKKQDYGNIELIFMDNSELADNDNVKFIKANYPEAKILRSGENLGFARAFNLLITQARKNAASYFLASNIDMIYEPNVVSELVNSVMKTPQIASATCKIKRWDFSERDSEGKGKTNFIDTVGINITKEHRFMDRGQGDIDHGQFDREEEIFGASGAAAIYRLSALDDVAFINEDGRKEYFDELMFMYKEDVDLAYRLEWAGYKCLYNPNAVIYHDRAISSRGRGIIGIIKGRLGKKEKYKEWSWLNHHIILQKMLDSSYSKPVILKTIWYEIKSNLFVLVFERHILKQVWQLFKLRKQIKSRRGQIKRRIKAKNHLEKLMSE
ncbi:MAG: glycosyltransferase family 2 protein [bacterium]|nr:glycosyltransferase family 2 protein [bacterium]